MSRDGKAAQLLTSGAVRVLAADDVSIVATVKGDTSVYRVSLYLDERYGYTRECGCKYARCHPGEEDCSHVLALERVWRIERQHAGETAR